MVQATSSIAQPNISISKHQLFYYIFTKQDTLNLLFLRVISFSNELYYIITYKFAI
ncbi:Uncharacterised protein [Myroides odoratus]|uniref:Uncharacterized protein n=1 Tax=Myroides odoratus TaxID=256 RepID=A0A378RMW7_MYROD|nr:Uncharacterised protein [Myroides odoratus]